MKRALLVPCDRDQHAADGRTMESVQQIAHPHAKYGDGRIVGPVPLQVDAEHGRTGDAAEPALATGELGPAIADGKE
jgi:hypothetical protein